MRRNLQANLLPLLVVGLACVPASHDARARGTRSSDLDTASGLARAHAREHVPDQRLVSDVQAALAAQAVALDDVNVRATQGIIELTGNVPTLLAYEQASFVVGHVRGVRSISNRISVAPRSVADDVLQTEISDALQRVALNEAVRAQVIRHVVTLEGDVQSMQERARVRRTVKSIPGVRGVVDLVQADLEGQRSDVAIQRDVADALRWDGHVDLRELAVDVVDGRVRLSGQVRGPREARVAEVLAWVEGVRSVDGRALTVRPGSEDPSWWIPEHHVSDADIADAIDVATTIDPRIVGTGVVARVEGGVVTLRGVVPRLASRKAVEQIASDTPGVRQVVNRVVVRAYEPRMEEVIAARVETALARDPRTNSEEVRVEVRDGTVVLSGTVDTEEEVERARELALGVPTVREVQNLVAVRFREVDERLEVRAWATPYQPYAAPVAQYRHVQVHPTQVELADNVRRQLYWSPFVDLGGISIDVVDDRVILSGEVEDWRERRYAIDNAYEGGAAIVEDRLTLRRG